MPRSAKKERSGGEFVSVVTRDSSSKLCFVFAAPPVLQLFVLAEVVNCIGAYCLQFMIKDDPRVGMDEEISGSYDVF